ncbi:MAG: hypothetical protein ABJA67_12715 [Chthonomonadales bacterium]
MSRLVDTKIGTYNLVKDGNTSRWLFKCPSCGEMLPLSEAHMQGVEPIDHESRVNPARLCKFQGTREFVPDLLSVIQSRILCGYPPSRPESMPEMMSAYI